MCQFTDVNVTAAGLTVPSVKSLELSAIVTSAVGWLPMTMVNVAVPPASVVISPLAGATVTPAVSLSRLDTDTSATAIPLYTGSALVAAPVAIVKSTVPSETASSTPATVTICAMFQIALVKVSNAGETVPSVRSSELSAIVTFATGWLVRTTVNVAVSPVSVVDRPLIGVTVTLAESSSVVLTETSATAMPLYTRSVLLAAPVTIVYATVPSTTASLTPVTVTVCATCQFADVNVTD